MKSKLIYVLITLGLTHTIFAQVNIHLPKTDQAAIQVYGYYPVNTFNNEPLEVLRPKQQLVQLDAKDWAAGIYTLYYTGYENRYINLIISENENNFNVYWIPKTGFLKLIDAPINNNFQDVLEEYVLLKRELNKIKKAEETFTSEDLQNSLQDEKEALLKTIDKLLVKTKTNREILDDYLIYIEEFEAKEKTTKDFWAAVNIKEPLLWSTPYQYSVLRKWRSLSQETTGTTTEQEHRFIDGVISHLGKNIDLHPFLNDWLGSQYDNNKMNDFYLHGINSLLALPNANAEYKLLWKNLIDLYTPLAQGSEVDVSGLKDQDLIQAEDDKVQVVFYSESCGHCVRALEQLKQAQDKVIAVRVFASENSIVNEDDFPSILFYHPEDPSIYETYVERGTPAIFNLVPKGGEWVISSPK